MTGFQRLRSIDEFEGKDVFLCCVRTKKVLKFIPIITWTPYGSRITEIIDSGVKVKGFAGLPGGLMKPVMLLQIFRFGIKKSISLSGLKKYEKTHSVAIIIVSDDNNDFHKLHKYLGESVSLIVYRSEILTAARYKEILRLENIAPEYRRGVLCSQADLLKHDEHVRMYKSASEAFSGNYRVTNIVAIPKTGNTTLQDTIYHYRGADGFVFHGISGCLPGIIDYIKNNLSNMKWISGVREPVSLLISLGFQIWTYYAASWIVDIPEYACGGDCFNPNFFVHEMVNYYDDPKQPEKKSFLNLMLDAKMYDFDILSFFDKEYKAILGLDVYSKPFDTKKGYEIIENNGTSLFVYRLESMNSIEKEIGEFLEIDDFKLIKSNTSDDKWYKDYYEQFKKNDFRITRADFDKLYNSKYMKHFYSEAEIAKFKDKWSFAVVEDETQL